MHWWWPGDRHGHGGDLNVAEIKRVAVIGAGVMGAGIAAQVANAGVPAVSYTHLTLPTKA